jgi:hypothetical protein
MDVAYWTFSYAAERTSEYIRIFFWSRYDVIPSDIKDGAGTIDTDNWVNRCASSRLGSSH